MSLTTKRIYEEASPDDGTRILIDRLWPRGMSKERARVDHWVRGVAPSDELRKWYRHEHSKWDRFRARYFAELDAVPEEVAALREAIGQGPATLLFSSKEERLNNAAALVEYLETRS